MKKLRWGVIGAGGIADRRTIPGMMLAKNAELIAVMDIHAEQVEKIRQKYGAKRGYTKEEDLLADPEVDAVYIATPIVLHAKQAKLAADYGKDILIEKPLAMTSDEGQRLFDQDILAVVGGQLRLLRVQDDGRGDIDRVNLRIGQQVLFLRVAALGAVFLADLLDLLSVDVHDGDQLCVLRQHHPRDRSAVRNAARADDAPT